MLTGGLSVAGGDPDPVPVTVAGVQSVHHGRHESGCVADQSLRRERQVVGDLTVVEDDRHVSLRRESDDVGTPFVEVASLELRIRPVFRSDLPEALSLKAPQNGSLDAVARQHLQDSSRHRRLWQPRGLGVPPEVVLEVRDRPHDLCLEIDVVTQGQDQVAVARLNDGAAVPEDRLAPTVRRHDASEPLRVVLSHPVEVTAPDVEVSSGVERVHEISHGAGLVEDAGARGWLACPLVNPLGPVVPRVGGALPDDLLAVWGPRQSPVRLVVVPEEDGVEFLIAELRQLFEKACRHMRVSSHLVPRAQARTLLRPAPEPAPSILMVSVDGRTEMAQSALIFGVKRMTGRLWHGAHTRNGPSVWSVDHREARIRPTRQDGPHLFVALGLPLPAAVAGGHAAGQLPSLGAVQVAGGSRPVTDRDGDVSPAVVAAVLRIDELAVGGRLTVVVGCGARVHRGFFFEQLHCLPFVRQNGVSARSLRPPHEVMLSSQPGGITRRALYWYRERCHIMKHRPLRRSVNPVEFLPPVVAAEEVLGAVEPGQSGGHVRHVRRHRDELAAPDGHHARLDVEELRHGVGAAMGATSRQRQPDEVHHPVAVGHLATRLQVTELGVQRSVIHSLTVPRVHEPAALSPLAAVVDDGLVPDHEGEQLLAQRQLEAHPLQLRDVRHQQLLDVTVRAEGHREREHLALPLLTALTRPPAGIGAPLPEGAPEVVEEATVLTELHVGRPDAHRLISDEPDGLR